MADASKLKRGLGTPPAPDEARTDLMPEPAAAGEPTLRPAAGTGSTQRIDARSLRRSGRTVHFATKVTPAFDNRVRQIAAETGKMLTEILEEALQAWEREHS
jgi:hypothetical protein